MKLLNNAGMGISKTEVNLKRLLAAAPQQQNQAKLVHVSLRISLDYLFWSDQGYMLIFVNL